MTRPLATIKLDIESARSRVDVCLATAERTCEERKRALEALAAADGELARCIEDLHKAAGVESQTEEERMRRLRIGRIS